MTSGGARSFELQVGSPIDLRVHVEVRDGHRAVAARVQGAPDATQELALEAGYVGRAAGVAISSLSDGRLDWSGGFEIRGEDAVAVACALFGRDFSRHYPGSLGAERAAQLLSESDRLSGTVPAIAALARLSLRTEVSR